MIFLEQYDEYYLVLQSKGGENAEANEFKQRSGHQRPPQTFSEIVQRANASHPAPQSPQNLSDLPNPQPNGHMAKLLHRKTPNHAAHQHIQASHHQHREQ